MIIYDFNIIGRVVMPFEANAPLIVDANAVLAIPDVLCHGWQSSGT